MSEYEVGYYIGYYGTGVAVAFLFGTMVGLVFWAFLRVTRGIHREVRRLFPCGDHLKREAIEGEKE